MFRLGWGFALLGRVMMMGACGRVTTSPPSPVENTAVAYSSLTPLIALPIYV